MTKKIFIKEELMYKIKMENKRYKLFEHMSREHGLTLLDSELDEIISIAEKVWEKDCQHPFENVISCGKLHNCTKCGKNI